MTRRKGIPLVDFEALKEIIEDDSSILRRLNPLEKVFLDIDGENKNLAECTVPEIMSWFSARFPHIHIQLEEIPDQASPLLKSHLFGQLSAMIEAHWDNQKGTQEETLH